MFIVDYQVSRIARECCQRLTRETSSKEEEDMSIQNMLQVQRTVSDLSK